MATLAADDSKEIALHLARSAIAAAVLICVAACSSSTPAIGNARSSPSPFAPAATIQELMETQVDPSADFIWAAVGTVITAAGAEDRRPRTDEDWTEVRRHVISLIEATNLLTIPGRRVADREFPSAGPGVLSSAQIERKLAADRAGFDAFALALRDVAFQALAAVDRKDPEALSRIGESMDSACEACHVANWYPHEVIPALPDFKSD